MRSEKTHSRVVHHRPQIAILDLVKRIDAPHTIVEQLVEDEADSGTSAQLVQVQVGCVSLDCRVELAREFGDDRQNDIGRVFFARPPAERKQLSLVLLKLRGDTGFNVGESGANMVQEDLRRR